MYLSCTSLTIAALASAIALAGCREASYPLIDPPLLTFDTAQVIEDERIWQVRTIRFMGDHLLVSNNGTRQLFVFDGAGDLVRTLGGPGSGPGEFGAVVDMTSRGDSVYVLDSLWQRLSLFVRGALQKDWSLREIPGIPNRLRVLDNGRVMLATERDFQKRDYRPGANFFRDSVQLVSVGLTESRVERHDLFAVPGVERMALLVTGLPAYPTRPAFGGNLSYALTDEGVMGADHQSGWVGLWSWQGDTMTIREPAIEAAYWSETELKVWEHWVDSVARTVHARNGEEEPFRLAARAAAERWNGRVPRAVFRDIKTDGQTIVVQRAEPNNRNPAEWLVLDRNGATLGRLVLPRNMRVMSVEGQRLAVVAHDELDRESILILRLQPSLRQQ